MPWNASFERARARIHDRAVSYRMVFLVQEPREPQSAHPWWAFWRAPRGGQIRPPGETVLRDLARYCYANKPTLQISQADQHVDPLAMAFAEGRRDVFNRITAMLNLTSDDIERIAHARSNE
jgi:hypothetical protein